MTMTSQDEFKRYRARIDQVKQFIAKYGLLQAVVYKTHLTSGEDQRIWIQAMAEWEMEYPGGWHEVKTPLPSSLPYFPVALRFPWLKALPAPRPFCPFRRWVRTKPQCWGTNCHALGPPGGSITSRAAYCSTLAYPYYPLWNKLHTDRHPIVVKLITKPRIRLHNLDSCSVIFRDFVNAPKQSRILVPAECSCDFREGVFLTKR